MESFISLTFAGASLVDRLLDVKDGSFSVLRKGPDRSKTFVMLTSHYNRTALEADVIAFEFGKSVPANIGTAFKKLENRVAQDPTLEDENYFHLTGLFALYFNYMKYPDPFTPELVEEARKSSNQYLGISAEDFDRLLVKLSENNYSLASRKDDGKQVHIELSKLGETDSSKNLNSYGNTFEDALAKLF